MEDFFELILTILLSPFENKIDSLFDKQKKLPSKMLGFVLMILLGVVCILLVFAICALCNYIFTGDWF